MAGCGDIQLLAAPSPQKGITVNEHDLEASYLDGYEHILEEYDPPTRSELAWRRGKPVTKHKAKKSQAEIAQELADTEGLEEGFHTTYTPGQFEEAWLLSSLRPFYQEQLIQDVLAIIKGGKEANVYRCRAHPTTGLDLVAAKVYRPRMFRNMRNDRVYREGRPVLTEGGRPVKKNDHRIMRALGKKTDFGVQVAHTSWLMHEFMAMQWLYQAGGAVPQPLAVSENALLMGYVGDERMAAPTLNTVALAPDEAERLFQETLRHVRLLLELGLVHGDLSAYNLLYWQGEITLIDLPQVVDIHGNSQARDILRRDLERTCDYFAGQGVACDLDALMGDLWGSYVGVTLRSNLADFSMWAYDHQDDDPETEERL